MGPRRSLLGLVVAAAGCGEPAYYPALAEAVDTGFDEVAQICGAAGTPIAHTLTVRNTLDRPLLMVVVDAACVETTLSMVQPFEEQAFVITDLDAVGAYVTLSSGSVRVGAREAAVGLDESFWVAP